MIAAPPVQAPDRISQILDTAVRLLEEHGWCQGQYMDERGRLCALGAIARAGKAGKITSIGFPMNPSYMSAYHRLASVVGTVAVGSWNDEAGRTVEEVKAALRQAATR